MGGPGNQPYRRLDERLTSRELDGLRTARSSGSSNKLTDSQANHAVHLQRALRSLPLEVIENHISVALKERSDFDLEAAQRFARMFNDRVWDFL